MSNTKSIQKRILLYSFFSIAMIVSWLSYAQEMNMLDKIEKRDSIVERLGLITKQKNYAGVAYVLTGNTIEKTAFNNTKNSLAGYIPGLYVSQDGGEPGAEWSSLLIRGKRTTSNGSNAPHILVDGFERDMNYMDPNEIESITVLKDAAATAMYGLKGASGVIEVKTKRGHEGKTRITFDSQFTQKSALNIHKPLGAVDYMNYYNQARVNDGYPDNFYSQDLISSYNNSPDPYQYPSVDWMSEFFDRNSFKQRYSLSIDGGSKIAKYFVHFSYVGDEGNLKPDPSLNKYSTQNRWDKYSIRTNIDVRITEKLLLQAGVSSMFGFVNNPGSSNGTAMYRSLLNYTPVAHPVLNENGSIAGTQFFTDNPFKILNKSGYSETFTRYVTATTRLQYDLSAVTKGLSLFGAFAYDNNYSFTSQRLKQTATYELLVDKNTLIPILDNEGNKTYKQWGNNTPLTLSGSSGAYYRRMNFEFGFNYDKVVGKHTLASRVFGFNYDFQNDNILAHATAGVSGGVNYSYDSKYLIDLSGSWSGTEQFPQGNRMFLYPAVGLGWVVTNEPFLNDNNALSYLKLRGSYGLTGSDRMSNGGTDLYYYYVVSLVRGGNAFFGEGNPASITSSNFTTGYVEGTIANPVLRPESTEKLNIGFDVAVLNNRLSANFDYFSEYTRNILAFSKSMPGMMGVPNNKMMLDNIGEVSNFGFELQLGWTDKIGKLGYFIQANATFAKNKVEYLDEEPGLAEPQTGYALDGYWGFKTDGFFQNDNEITSWADQSSVGRTIKGDLKFVNQNPDVDNVINEYDRVYLGTISMPDWFYGVNLGVKYEGWEFSCLFQGVEGLNKVYRDGINRPFSNSGNMFDFHVDNFWAETNSANPAYPRLTVDGSSSTKAKADFWIKDASYLRLKNIELSYLMPTDWIAKNSDVRIYFSGTNLVCWDQLNGITDPDISSDGQAYPVNRMFSLGLRLKL